VAKQTYQKNALNFIEQIAKLSAKGMVFPNNQQAQQQLSNISYYRLSGYWHPFRQRNQQQNITNQFEEDTSFNTVISLYEFDCKLRTLILDAIERIEIAVRTQFTYHIGHAYGAFGHTDAKNFHPKFNHASWFKKLEDETYRSSDEFIKHYKSKYQGFPTIPIWMLTEVMSLGALSIGYSGLINDQKSGVEDKKAIAQHFNLHHKKLANWLHILTYVRNVCAHHSRLWNRELAIRPDKTKDKNWQPPITPRNDRVFYILLMLRHLLIAINSNDDWAREMNSIIAPLAENGRWRASMGIPKNWREHPIWK